MKPEARTARAVATMFKGCGAAANPKGRFERHGLSLHGR